MTTLPFKITLIPGTGLAQYFACSVPKKQPKKKKLFDVRGAEQWSAEAQTTRNRAVEPGPSSLSPEKRQTPRAANGHRVPNPKHLLQLTLMRCIPTFFFFFLVWDVSPHSYIGKCIYYILITSCYTQGFYFVVKNRFHFKKKKKLVF